MFCVTRPHYIALTHPLGPYQGPFFSYPYIVEQDISDEQKELNIYPKDFASNYKFHEVLLHLSDTMVL